VVTGGAVVLGDEPLRSTLSTASPAATQTPQTPALVNGPAPVPGETPSNETTPDADRQNTQWYAMTEEGKKQDTRALGAAGVDVAGAERNRRLAELRSEREVSLHVPPASENAEAVKLGVELKAAEGIPVESTVEPAQEQSLVAGELKVNTASVDAVPAVPYDTLSEYPADWPLITSTRIDAGDQNTTTLGEKLESTDVADSNSKALPLALGRTAELLTGTENLPAVEGKDVVGYSVVPAEDPQPARKPRLMPVNPWVMTAEDQLSTFALDVDTASYDIARRYINDGFLPPKYTVRMEEFVNSFDYNYPAGQDDSEAFTVYAEAGESPFTEGTVLLKIGVRGKVVGRDQAKPANLVFVIDTSGSMDRDDRLPLVRQSLAMVLDQLSPQDRVSFVSYGTEARLLVEAVPATEKMRILDALESLQTGGSTNLLSGVELGYEVAQRQFITNGVNRVILNSDGVANVGPSETQDLIDQAQTLRRQGVTFTSVGFGAGNYDDEVLEQLANKGDGGYLFVGSLDEAKRVFVDNLAATRQTIAFDAKIQVNFDPARVRRYRLIGYENRDIADKDFRNDAIDAGEVGSGQSATALYEVEVLGPTFAADDQPDLGTVYVRYRDPDSGKVREIESRLTNDMIARRDAESDPRFFLAAGAARFAEVLRGSEYVGDPDVNRSLAKVQGVLEPAAAQLPMDAAAQELVTLVRRSQGLPRAE
jgi:Ca-activated chloride channel family protein